MRHFVASRQQVNSTKLQGNNFINLSLRMKSDQLKAKNCCTSMTN